MYPISGPGRAGSPSKNTRSQAPTTFQNNADDTSDQEDQRSPSPDLKTQFRALRDAQVKQALDVAETKTSMANIQKLLLQLTASATGSNIVRETIERPQPECLSATSSIAPPDDSPTTGQDDGTPLTTSSYTTPWSKKRPDSKELSDGVDPTFESWRILVKGKLRANADHFPTEEDRMDYVFGRTTGKAQKHLLPRFDEDSPARFTTAEEMIQYLAARYINPNKVRDARYDYGKLLMKASESFAEFQTTFLHLAGEGQIHSDNLRLDLYDKLTTQLQERLAATLEDLDTYQKLANRCLSLDTELKRISVRVDRQKRFKEERASTPAPKGSLPVVAPPIQTRQPLPSYGSPAILQRSVTPVTSTRFNSNSPAPATAVTCYNCRKPGHVAGDCAEPKRMTDLKEIEEEEEEEDSEAGKDDA
jgi:hypothetical protein